MERERGGGGEGGGEGERDRGEAWKLLHSSSVIKEACHQEFNFI